MRVTIDHREAISAFGRKQFFVDCTVQFSEAERAVIRNRQLGDHNIAVDHDIPWFRSIRGYIAVLIVLRLTFILSLVAILPTLVIPSLLGMSGGWWIIVAMVCGASYFYRKHLERQFKKSAEKRHISLSQMMKRSKFTVYAPDAYLASEAEKSILTQISDLKNRMVAIAPGLAEKQVYAREP
jgi:hypothetical protein